MDQPTPATTHILENLDQNLSRSFQETYRGEAYNGFFEYLTHNEKLLKRRVVSYYARVCSVVQSSGTGKSRMITELCKRDVIVIYINMRLKEGEPGFPGRDSIPSNILTEFPSTGEEYLVVCYAFFTALFDTVAEYLLSNHDTGNDKAGVMEWAHQLCDVSVPPRSSARTEFFHRVKMRYERVLADRFRARERPVGAATDPEDCDLPLFIRVIASYRKLTESLQKIFTDDSDRPKLVIAFDEAHQLTVNRGYRPADVLCRVVSEYSHHRNHAVWVVFVSTTFKVADLSPPKRGFNSDRVASAGQALFPPYTKLGWDQSATGPGDIDPEDVSRLEHIIGYGRPLWHSLKGALTPPGRVLELASSKLCGGHPFHPEEVSHVLAVLGQRFGLNITIGHLNSIEHLETGVESHLRICLGTTLDRKWKFTSYPSEPLLSSVAATQLHEPPENMDVALRTLMAVVNSGLIDIGQRGELASQLLWLLAKDLFIRTVAQDVVTARPSKWEERLVDCQMIPVVDWLEFIFGKQVWHEGDTQASLVRTMFKNAYVNFSHWVRMDGNISGPDNEDHLSLDEWTRCHWQRTCAVQCNPLQPLVDKAIPIYFKGGPETESVASPMSHIFVSDRVRKSSDSRDTLQDITQRSEHLRGDDGELPYIAILADLGQPSSFSVTFPEKDVTDRCLRVYAAGIDATTYPFLARYPTLMQTLQDLVLLEQIPEMELSYVERLNAQVRFGGAPTPEHMRWENE